MEKAKHRRVIALSAMVVARFSSAYADEPLPPQGDAEEILVISAPAEASARTSTEAVTVVDLADAQASSATLGEQLARTEGITVQRSGGLGSRQRLALSGFSGDQIRIFFDGIPLAYTGLGSSLSDIPLGLVDRAEIYHGVVPIRFGADALGGAINLVSRAPTPGVHGQFSWQAGSWDTQRLALNVQAFDDNKGIGTRFGGTFDSAKNNWPIDVEVASLSGQITAANVMHRHDRYRAGTGYASLVVRDQAWADRFDLTAMASTTFKEIPHNRVMTVPYGEVWWRRAAAGLSADYSKLVLPSLQLQITGAYGYRRTRLVDLSEHVYNWFGQQIASRPQAGEVDGKPHDLLTWQHSAYGRVRATWIASPRHKVTLTITPDLAKRSGDERQQDASDTRDVHEANQSQFKLTTGIGWDGSFAQDRVLINVFGKSYVYRAHTVGITTDYAYETKDHSLARFGGGAGIRGEVAPHVYLKGSYEYATRLPGPDEVFGNGILIGPNLALQPETSHNANVALQVVGLPSVAGVFDASLRGIFRDADDLIVLLSRDVTLQWQNIYSARALGLQGALAWTSPGDWVKLSGSATWTELRNRATEGSFAAFAGDRIPNRPWLNATGQLLVQASNIAGSNVAFQGYWTTRYVHAFYRGWASIGLASSKQQIPQQVSHTLGITITTQPTPPLHLAASLEVANLSNARLYDMFGVQRPGRSVMGKLSFTW